MSEHPHTDFLISETKDLLLRQLNDADTIDTKASILLGTSALIVTAALTILVSVPVIQKQTSIIIPFWILVSASLAALVVSVLLALLSYRITSYKDTINPRAAYEQWAELDDQAMRIRYLHNLIGAYEKNTVIVDSKAKRIGYSLISLGVAVLCGAAAVILYFVSF